jgi:hypothetical protein
VWRDIGVALIPGPSHVRSTKRGDHGECRMSVIGVGGSGSRCVSPLAVDRTRIPTYVVTLVRSRRSVGRTTGRRLRRTVTRRTVSPGREQGTMRHVVGRLRQPAAALYPAVAVRCDSSGLETGLGEGRCHSGGRRPRLRGRLRKRTGGRIHPSIETDARRSQRDAR